MHNPVGYLYRVGQSRTRPRRRRPVFWRSEHEDPTVEPKLEPALARLSERQRVAVVLVHGFGWTLGEVAELMGVTVATIQTHADRGMRQLRERLGVDNAAI
jgi:DNA-directed RNA polymerase specialized sigma24 family protein